MCLSHHFYFLSLGFHFENHAKIISHTMSLVCLLEFPYSFFFYPIINFSILDSSSKQCSGHLRQNVHIFSSYVSRKLFLFFHFLFLFRIPLGSHRQVILHAMFPVYFLKCPYNWLFSPSFLVFRFSNSHYFLNLSLCSFHFFYYWLL